MDDRVERLLAAVWGNRKGYVFLPFKVRESDPTKGWHEVPGIPYAGTIPSLKEPQGRADQYFCPVVFSEPKRRKEFALPTNVLWADLDPVNPETCRIRPSVAWESSPGRYHALWFLNQDIPPDEAAALSKSIAYADGGDHGGWDLTQVLRIPGTRNYKYDSTPEVKLLWAKSVAYAPEEIRGAYPPVNGTTSHTNGLADWPQVDEAVIGTAIAALPQGYRTRLFQEPLGDRSTELQKLTRDLVRRGLAPEIVLHLIQRSTWNKFAGRADETRQLLRQLESAQAAVALKKEKEKKPKPQESLQLETISDMQVHQWSNFMSIPTSLKWLVDDAWVDRTVGFISGRSKSYKTWMALDLALSIVSGSAFLGRYPVRRTGPVILVQEEDPSSVLQDRLRLVAKSKGMLPKLVRATNNVLEIEYPDYPLHVINLQGFNLGVHDRVAQVRKLIAEINPVMVILDPLIVMLPSGVDEYKANTVGPVLQSVKMWREEFGCSVVIVHHWNKGKNEDGERMAEHMYGSFVFHAWLESALHVMPVIPDAEAEDQRINTVMVEREFKAAPSGRALKLQFNIDTVREYTYGVEFEDNIKLGAREQAVIDMISQAGPSTTPEIVAATGYRRPDVVEICGRLVRANLLKGRKGGGRNNPTYYWLPDQTPPPSNS